MKTTATTFRRAWTAGWFGAAAMAAANGSLRDLVYLPRIGELAARQLSTAGLLMLLAAYLWWLDQRWPIPTARAAVGVGAAWTVTTLLFEFGLGHFVEHKPWQVLLADYDITSGRIWLLIPIWVAIGPTVIRRLRVNRPEFANIQQAKG
ncbi:MAG TPA: hypothetical protein VGD71_19930 [Kribbella sp.]|jgi:hypothetical protein